MRYCKRSQQQVRPSLFLKMSYGFVALTFLLFVSDVSSNAIGQKELENLEDKGLYNASDSVIVLNDTNLKASVYHSKRAWLVEFYNSWCGFCQRFAPIWKSLAKSVHGWRDIVAIAAIDCAKEDNTPLCRDYEVMRYPTLKFFHINSNKENLGLEIQKDKNEVLIMQVLIDQMEKEQQEQRGDTAWPNIIPYRGNDVETLWHGAPSNIQYQFLIFEEPKAYLGAEVILDLHKLENIRIRRVNSENEFLRVTSKVDKFPSAIAIDKDNSQTVLKIDPVTREGIRDSILDFLKSKGLSTEIKDDEEETSGNESYSTKFNNNNQVEEPEYTSDQLHQLDLESALRYSLNNEIPLTLAINGERLKALKIYLKVLVTYFPVYMPKAKTYLQAVEEIIENRNNITGKEFKQQVKVKEKDLAPVYSAPKTWIGCKGSSPTFRGYPCGLWTMFHTLTVAASEDIDDTIDVNHPSVLEAMHGYIKNFFGCADCSDHFQEMSKKRKLFEARGKDDSILWLWRAHNEVNERLSGDNTEDPQHKKLQYPSENHCPQCKFPDGKWNEIEVLRYLKAKYSKRNINLHGISNETRQSANANSISSSGMSYRRMGWNFTMFDFSICVILYAISATILILVCIKFAYRRHHKKKLSIQHLLGIV